MQRHAFEKSMSSNPLADLEETIREAGGNFEYPWDIDTGDSHLEELILPGRKLMLAGIIWNPLSSLMVPELTHSLHVGTSPRISSSPEDDFPRTQPYHQRDGTT